jgi:hypothetical protein
VLCSVVFVCRLRKIALSNGYTEGCRGIGPGTDMFDATRIIGQQQVRVRKNVFMTEIAV